jgi:hypothetical protein
VEKVSYPCRRFAVAHLERRTPERARGSVERWNISSHALALETANHVDFPAHRGRRDLGAGRRIRASGSPASAALGKRRRGKQDAGGYHQWHRVIFDALQASDSDAVLLLSMLYVPLLVASVFLSVMQTCARMTMQRRWRAWLNNLLIDRSGRRGARLVEDDVSPGHTLREAQIIIESWRRHYNTIRPHRLRRVAGSATPTGSAGHAGATPNVKTNIPPGPLSGGRSW